MSKHARFWFEAGPRGTCQLSFGLFEREFGQLGMGESDGGLLMGDLGLEFGALTAASEPAEAVELLLGGGQSLFGRFERLLVLAVAAFQGASCDLACLRTRLNGCELLGGRAL
jgi:hypothetical protein